MLHMRKIAQLSEENHSYAKKDSMPQTTGLMSLLLQKHNSNLQFHRAGRWSADVLFASTFTSRACYHARTSARTCNQQCQCCGPSGVLTSHPYPRPPTVVSSLDVVRVFRAAAGYTGDGEAETSFKKTLEAITPGVLLEAACYEYVMPSRRRKGLLAMSACGRICQAHADVG